MRGVTSGNIKKCVNHHRVVLSMSQRLRHSNRLFVAIVFACSLALSPVFAFSNPNIYLNNFNKARNHNRLAMSKPNRNSSSLLGIRIGEATNPGPPRNRGSGNQNFSILSLNIGSIAPRVEEIVKFDASVKAFQETRLGQEATKIVSGKFEGFGVGCVFGPHQDLKEPKAAQNPDGTLRRAPRVSLWNAR